MRTWDGSQQSIDKQALESIDKQALEIAENSFEYYRRKAKESRFRYHAVEITQILIASAITVTGILRVDTRIPGVLGALLILVVSVRSLFQWHENWLGYTSAGTQIRHAKELYAVHAPPYNETDRAQRLVAHVAALEKEETAGWVGRRQTLSSQPSSSIPSSQNSQ
jgi:Protein of unknown function (DUF4231)